MTTFPVPDVLGMLHLVSVLRSLGQEQATRGTVGGDKEARSAGAAEAVPPSSSPADREPPPCSMPCLSAVCRSAATASPPVRATLSRARRVKAALEDELKGGGALALALTAVLGLSSRTEAASAKGVEKA
jgi:hypothetical protein